MSVDIDEYGVMRVIAETPLEAYALSKWTEANCIPDVSVKTRKLIFDWSLSFPPTARIEG